MNIPITKAMFDEKDKAMIVKPLETGWVVQGPYVKEFENQFASFTGAHHALATSNCTTALHLGLIALQIGQGDKVIVPSFTYVASANAVEYTGAEVVFCDIELDTFNINVNQLEALLESDSAIKAIMPVHLFGLCADMTRIMPIAKHYRVSVIEDAACAFDSLIDGQHAGTFGDCGCFSFHPRKAITTGEGGMLITNQERIANVVSQLRDHGASKSDLTRHKEKGGSLLPDFTMRGYNYRMTDMQGALGVSQMHKASAIMQGRRRIAKRYTEALNELSELQTPMTPDHYTHAFQSYVCLYTGGEDLSKLSMKKIDSLNRQRNEFMQHLADKGIATRQGTHAVHTLDYYQKRYGIKNEDFIHAYAADRLSITLPVYADMTDQEFNYVIQHIEEAITQCAEFAA